MEQTPTYKRTREILDSIYQQASGGEDLQKNSEKLAEREEPIQGTIKFS